MNQAPPSEHSAQVVDLSSASTARSALPMNKGKLPPVLKSCEGILPDYHTASIQPLLGSYCTHAAIAGTSSYRAGIANNVTNLFSKKCTKEGIGRRTKKGVIFLCDECYRLNVS